MPPSRIEPCVVPEDGVSLKITQTFGKANWVFPVAEVAVGVGSWVCVSVGCGVDVSVGGAVGVADGV